MTPSAITLLAPAPSPSEEDATVLLGGQAFASVKDAFQYIREYLPPEEDFWAVFADTRDILKLRRPAAQRYQNTRDLVLGDYGDQNGNEILRRLANSGRGPTHVGTAANMGIPYAHLKRQNNHEMATRLSKGGLG